MERGDRFDHPLIERYASKDMARLFSPRNRHTTWRDGACAAELLRARRRVGVYVSGQIGLYDIHCPYSCKTMHVSKPETLISPSGPL